MTLSARKGGTQKTGLEDPLITKELLARVRCMMRMWMPANCLKQSKQAIRTVTEWVKAKGPALALALALAVGRVPALAALATFAVVQVEIVESIERLEDTEMQRARWESVRPILVRSCTGPQRKSPLDSIKSWD